MNLWKRYLVQFLCSLAAVAFAPMAHADDLSEAQKHLDAGLAYYDDPSGPRYEEAYREFHAAYAINPSYKLLANIGTCALYLERDEEAIVAYEKYLKQAKPGDIPAKKRTLMQSDINTLRASLVKLKVEATPETLTLIDERFPSKGPAIVNRYEVTEGNISLGIHPGAHRVTAHLEGYEDQRWEFDASPASAHSHRFELVEVRPKTENPDKVQPPPPPPSRPQVDDARPKSRTTPASVYVGLAATAVFAGAATVTGLMAISSRDDFIKRNDGTQVSSARDARDEMRRNMLMSDLSLGAALLSAGITTYLYVTRPYTTPAKDFRPADVATRIVPALGGRLVGVSLRSKF